MHSESGSTWIKLDEMAFAAGAFSIAAGVIHGIASLDYWSIWWGYATFFLLAAMVQVAYGLVLFVQPWRYDDTGAHNAENGSIAHRLYRWGAISNGAIVVLWVIARTLGTPFFGPLAGQVQPITPLSALALIIMVVLVWYLLRMLRLLRLVDPMLASRGRLVPGEPANTDE